MASPGTENEDEAKSSAENTNSRDNGAKPPEPAPETKTASPSAETTAAPNEASPPVAAPLVEAPPAVEAPPVAAPVERSNVTETVHAPEANVTVPTEPPSTGAAVESTGALPAPPGTSPSSSSIEISTVAGRLSALFGGRPSAAWLAVGGAVAVVAFVAGVFTGRGLRSDSERRATPATVPPKAAPTAPATAPVVASPGGSAAAPLARPRTVSTATKPASAGFNAQAAKVAIDRIVPRLKACKQAGEPPGSATVTVTFAPTGRVSSAQVTNTRYAGTRTGNCITQRLREARVPEFTGAPVTVKRSVAVR